MSVQLLEQPAATSAATSNEHPVATPTVPRRTTIALYTNELERAGLRYFQNAHGERREFMVLAFASKLGTEPSRVVLHRSLRKRNDIQIIAYLFPEEPAENAVLMCGEYLGYPLQSKRLARRLSALVRLALEYELEEPEPHVPDMGERGGEVTADGVRYRLMQVHNHMSIPELRWYRCPPLGQAGPGRVVSLRDVVAVFESYAPFKEATAAAIKQYRHDPQVSVAVLRGEWQRTIEHSQTVLNCVLRAKVQEAIDQGATYSEIAKRCGMIKTDRRGRVSGETSWLSRRIGLAPEGSETEPAVWVHSRVLEKIAWRGLGIAPREAEAA